MIIYEKQWSSHCDPGFRCAICGRQSHCYSEACGEEEGIRNLPGRYVRSVAREAAPEEEQAIEAEKLEKQQREYERRCRTMRPTVNKMMLMVANSKVHPSVKLAILKTTQETLVKGNFIWRHTN